MKFFRSMAVPFAGLLYVLFLNPAIAKQHFTPMAMELVASNYKLYCEQHIAQLTAMLRAQKTLAKDTETPAFVAFEKLLKCDFETNPILKTLKQDSSIFTDADNYIDKFGLKRTIADIESTQAKARIIYRIEELEERARSKIGLSEHEVKTLAGFAKVIAKYDALLAVLRSFEN